MKSIFFHSITTLLLVPLLASGQTGTYTINIAKFSSRKIDEFSPVYYKKGIVFCSNRNHGLFMNYFTPENKGLLKINFVDPATGKVRLFSRELTTKFNDGPASFSRNFDTVYFSRNLKVSGAVSENSNPRNKLGIFTAVEEGGKWGKILDIRFNNEYYNITTPYISPDGKRLFFASDNPAGFGGTDLYYCNWKGDYWDDPINLGPEVNTAGNESYPFVDREGGIFFTSDGRKGLGGKDIFYTKESGKKWLTPVPLDAPVNSEYDDFALVADSVMNEGYFSSKRGSSIDIYYFRTNIHQLFYCKSQRINQYCFKFTDESKIPIDERYVQPEWNFGDGTTLFGTSVEHCFKGPGRYKVTLDIVDKKTGRSFYPEKAYNLNLTDIEQPVISAPASGMTGENISFDGLSSNFPGCTILNYTWYFSDGARKTGDKVAHSFQEKGDFEVKLGLYVRNNKTGEIRQSCSSVPVKIFGDRLDKTAFEKRVIKADPPVNITDYDHAKLEYLYSNEKAYNPDVVFRVEILTSKIRLPQDDKAFRNIPRKYTIREEYIPSEKTYSYFVCEEMSLMETYPSFIEITSLGFTDSRVRIFTVDDPAVKEINNLKRIFGISADVFFRKNDFAITPAGTQLLDLVLGIMAKYPNIRLEIENHTDNVGSQSANLLLSQKRAEAMTGYLATNGVSPMRLVAKGFGGTKPVASNYFEADRKLNRRVNFVVVKE
ncbi:MAG: PKD domain-containing protein [Bacteroidota bacterium]|nr:PKD domain-containing protein [Bacteroidota bacterium]